MKRSIPMKRIMILVALFSILAPAANLNSRVFSPATRLLIFDFQPIGVTETESRTITELISAKIVKHHVFTVIDRTHLDSILKEHELQRSGFTSHEDRMKLGKMLNSEKIMYGSVSRMNSLYYVTIKITDVVSGTIEWSDAVKIKDITFIDEYITLYLQKIVQDEEIGNDIFMGKEKKSANPSKGAGNDTVMKNERITSLETGSTPKKAGKNSWYWGFGEGAGNGRIVYNDGRKTSMKTFARHGSSEDMSEDQSPFFIELGIGCILNQNVHLGISISGMDAIYTINSQKQYQQQNIDSSRTETLSTSRLMPVITYFPFSKGLFFRGGVGYSMYDYEVDYKSNTIRDVRYTCEGVVLMAGMGLAIPVYKSWNIGMGIDLVKETYGKRVKSVDSWTVYFSSYFF